MGYKSKYANTGSDLQLPLFRNCQEGLHESKVYSVAFAHRFDDC